MCSVLTYKSQYMDPHDTHSDMQSSKYTKIDPIEPLALIEHVDNIDDVYVLNCRVTPHKIYRILHCVKCTTTAYCWYL